MSGHCSETNQRRAPLNTDMATFSNLSSLGDHTEKDDDRLRATAPHGEVKAHVSGVGFEMFILVRDSIFAECSCDSSSSSSSSSSSTVLSSARYHTSYQVLHPMSIFGVFSAAEFRTENCWHVCAKFMSKFKFLYFSRLEVPTCIYTYTHR